MVEDQGLGGPIFRDERDAAGDTHGSLCRGDQTSDGVQQHSLAASLDRRHADDLSCAHRQGIPGVAGLMATQWVAQEVYGLDDYQ